MRGTGDNMNDINFLKQNGVDVDAGINLLGDIQMYNTIIEEFLNNFSDRMGSIDIYLKNNDLANYAIEVHSLKSDSKYLGFTVLADLAYKHEMASKAGDSSSCNNHYKELVNEANRIIEVVKKYLGKDNSSATKVITDEEITQFSKAILVADDSPIIRDFVKETFQNKFDVVMAGDGKEVINIISSNPNIVAILLDLNMPNVDGFEVLEYFKNHDLFKKIPVSVISGANDKESIDKAFKYPIIDMINKPFNMDNVRLIVEKMLSISSN